MRILSYLVLGSLFVSLMIASNISVLPEAAWARIDTDGDGIDNSVDTDDDNDGVPDAEDTNPIDPNMCTDIDSDACDDCSIGTDGFGPLDDNDPANDGLDTDGDGLCDVGDSDDDNDGVPDNTDNCPVDANPGQEDADNNGVGDLCEPVANSDVSWGTLKGKF